MRPDRYAITLFADYPGIAYPVRTDVTLRRLQKFHARPGERLRVRLGDAPAATFAANGERQITIAGVVIPGAAGVRLAVERSDGGGRPER